MRNILWRFVTCLSLLAPLESIALVNGGFETGNLTGWNCGEDSSAAGLVGGQAVLSNLTVPPLDPTQGNSMAMISNGGGPRVNQGLPPGVPLCSGGGDGQPPVTRGDDAWKALVDTFPTGPNEVTNFTMIWQTFSIKRPLTLSFDWNFLSNDGAGDWAFVSINENPMQVLAGAVPPYADAEQLTPPGFQLITPEDEANGGYGSQTGWRRSQYYLPAGDYTLTFGVTNGAGDTRASSALLVDNIQLITEPAALLLPLTALGAMGLARRRRLN
jgi:hypothetical protein